MPDELNPDQVPMSDDEFFSSLHEHALEAARRSVEILEQPLCAENLETFLCSDVCLRLPTELRFDEEGLDAHQFAEPSFVMRDGLRRCVLHVHPRYEERPETHAAIVAYMAAAINYGSSASSDLCEEYGATLTGVPVDEFYDTVCRVADL
jgi:hypothetical protein